MRLLPLAVARLPTLPYVVKFKQQPETRANSASIVNHVRVIVLVITKVPVSELETNPLRGISFRGLSSVALDRCGPLLLWGTLRIDPEESLYMLARRWTSRAAWSS